MNIKELFDFICDEFNKYEEVKFITTKFTESGKPPCVYIETKNKRFFIYKDFTLIIGSYDNRIYKEEVRQFDDIDFLRWELQGLLQE